MTGRRLAPFAISFILTGILIAVFWMVAAVPQQNKAAALEGQRVATAEANDQREVYRDSLAEKRSNLGQIQAQGAAFTAAFPEGAAQQDLFNSVIAAAEETGVTLKTVNPDTPVSGGPLPGETPEEADARMAAERLNAEQAVADGTASEIADGSVATLTLTIEVTGEIEQIKSFVEKLETMQRPVSISGLSVTDNNGVLEGTFTAKSFFVKALPSMDPVDQEASEG